MKAILAKAIRQILFIAGGAIGAKSTASDSDIEAITGAVMIVASLAWSWFNEWRERKAATKAAAMVGLLTLLLVPGCKTAPTADQIQRVRDITRAAVQSAVTLELTAFPAHRPYLEGSLKAANEMIAQGKVSAAALGALVNTLPLDPNVVRYTTTGLLVWDTISVFWLNPATDSALLATANGISDGLKAALAAVPAGSKSKTGTQQNASQPKAGDPPAPTPSNTCRL